MESNINSPLPKAVVILSGGLDSTVALAIAVRHHYNAHALSFFYGQRHAVELQHATEIARYYGIKHEIVDIASIVKLVSNSALTNSRIQVPEGHYTSENMKVTVVPNRNAIMLSIAYGYAMNIGADSVWAGMHAGDHAIYPDCRPQFITQFEGMETTALDTVIKLQTPFINKTKSDIVKWGDIYHAPMNLTWSCYKGGDKHCGRCATCVERAEAFHLAGVTDPTEYEDPTYWKTVCNG